MKGVQSGKSAFKFSPQPTAVPTCLVRRVAANETLFQEGDLKTCLYRVRAGADSPL